MRRLLFLTLSCLVCVLPMVAQNPGGGFSPEKFNEDMKAFIKAEAKLTDEEAKHFFPLFFEMHEKQREHFGKIRSYDRQKPQTEEACRKAIADMDAQEIELKKIQQTYHGKMLKVVSATKLFDVLRAEEAFHRKELRKWSQQRPKGFGHHQGR